MNPNNYVHNNSKQDKTTNFYLLSEKNYFLTLVIFPKSICIRLLKSKKKTEGIYQNQFRNFFKYLRI